MATKKTKETVDQTTEPTSNPEYDIYKQYQVYFEEQQKQILEYWTNVLNNTFWWTKK